MLNVAAPSEKFLKASLNCLEERVLNSADDGGNDELETAFINDGFETALCNTDGLETTLCNNDGLETALLNNDDGFIPPFLKLFFGTFFICFFFVLINIKLQNYLKKQLLITLIMFYIDITYNSLLQHLYYTQNINHLYLDKNTCCRLSQVTVDDFRMIYQAIQNPQNCLVNFKFHRVAFMTNLNTITRIPLISKYLEGSYNIPENYKVFNPSSLKFELLDQNLTTYASCLLVSIDFELQNIPSEVLNLFQYLPNIIVDSSIVYSFQLHYLKNLIEYSVIINWSDDYVFSSIRELVSILGIKITKFDQKFNYETQADFYNNNNNPQDLENV